MIFGISGHVVGNLVILGMKFKLQNECLKSRAVTIFFLKTKYFEKKNQNFYQITRIFAKIHDK